MYYLYIDESGVEGDSTGKNSPHDDWFTAGGIIVDEQANEKFSKIHEYLIDKYFTKKGITLDPDFKLHYHDLRNSYFPYSEISNPERWSLANEIFDAIKTVDCHLISASIHKKNHRSRYEWAASVRAYTLLVSLERFQYFLEERSEEGKAIYEKLTNSLRWNVERDLIRLKTIPTFPLFTNLGNIKGKIINGDPTKEKTLQFADFFIYAPHIKSVTNGNAMRRWEEIKFKYYNLNGYWNKTGYVVIDNTV